MDLPLSKLKLSELFMKNNRVDQKDLFQDKELKTRKILRLNGFLEQEDGHR